MKRFALPLALSILLAGWVGAYTTARISFFRVEKEESDLLITWQAEVEEQVRAYDVQRRTAYSNDQFVTLRSIHAHGPGKLYLYRDDQVYKSASERVDYRLEVVFEDGQRQVLSERSVNYTPTAIRRTWGSIKAMFQ